MKEWATRVHLLFGRENARNAGEVAFSAMTIDRIEQGAAKRVRHA